MMNLEQQILRMLDARKAQDRPLTINDFARQFGANPQIVTSLARQLVDSGQARPSMVTVHGVPTLHGLLPQIPTEDAATLADDDAQPVAQP